MSVAAKHNNMVFYFYLMLSVNCVLAFKNVDYMGYKVYSVKLETEEQQDNFYLLKSDIVDYWRKPSWKNGVVGQAMVPPSHFDWFEEKLQELGVEKKVVIGDVYKYLVDTENTQSRSSQNGTEPIFDFKGYYRYNEILSFMNNLDNSISNSSTSVQVIEFGRTEENRSLVYLKIGTNDTSNKPVIVIEAGIIPREWVTIPTALYVVEKLLEAKEFLNDFDWIVIPVLNPDGYEYTHTNLRLWQKSMSTTSHLGFVCPGVNINRNFDIDWSVSDSSSSPCSHLFAGANPFSEIESQLILSIQEEYKDRIRLYISLQNTAGFISYPWQYEKAASGLFRQHLLVGLDMVAAMNDTYGLDIGSVAYGDRVSGTSTDYIRKNDVMYTFNIDINQRGGNSFHVPEEEIVNVAEDVWRAISVAATSIV